MGGNESEQAQRQLTPKEFQATKVMRKPIEDQDHCPTILVSKCSKLVTLIT